MTNSAKTRPTPAFEKKIDKTVRDGPQFRPSRLGIRETPALPSREDGPSSNSPTRAAEKVGGAQSGAHSDAKPGGGERNRTVDLLLAKQALSQLSYGPLICCSPLNHAPSYVFGRSAVPARSAC